MNTEQKIEMIKKAAIANFKKDLSVDEICVAIISDKKLDVLNNGISFTEIAPLVKNIGQAEGFIISLMQRKENATEAIKGLVELPSTFGHLEENIKADASEFDVPESFIRKLYKAKYEDMGLTVPKKPTLTDWQAQIVECFVKDRNISQDELTNALVGKTANPAHYARMTHEMINKILEGYGQ